MYNPRVISFDGAYQAVPAVSGGAIAVNDFVTIKTDGQAEATGAGDPIFGVSISSASGAASNLLVVRAQRGMRVLMDNDNDGTTFAATHVGARFDIIGASGAQLVDTNTADQAGDGSDSGQLLCVEYNPKGYGFDTDLSIGMFEIAEVQ